LRDAVIPRRHHVRSRGKVKTHVKARVWENLYQSMDMPRVDPVVTGFNANIDRVITVTPDVLRSLEHLRVKGSDTILGQLKQSMSSCSAGELFIKDPSVFLALSEPFSGSGTLSIGGQAGIAATHLKSLGVTPVTCAVPGAGPGTRGMLRDAGVIPLTFEPGSDNPRDMTHLVFEFSPGPVPPADNVIPRNNRFIVSPLHDASTVLIPDAYLDPFLQQIAPCRRAFLSGYQYLRTEQEFMAAAGQARKIRGVHPLMRTHAECVSGADPRVMAMMLRYIFPVCDSIGLNEQELGLFIRTLQPVDQISGVLPPSTPADCVRDAIALADATGVPRVHFHTFGYYFLVLEAGAPSPESSRNALLVAARATATAAGGDGQVLSREGLLAYESVRGVLGKEESPGIFRDADRVVVFIPTYISRNIRKTAGLGDILSSTAFVTDPF